VGSVSAGCAATRAVTRKRGVGPIATRTYEASPAFAHAFEHASVLPSLTSTLECTVEGTLEGTREGRRDPHVVVGVVHSGLNRSDVGRQFGSRTTNLASMSDRHGSHGARDCHDHRARDRCVVGDAASVAARRASSARARRAAERRCVRATRGGPCRGKRSRGAPLTLGDLRAANPPLAIPFGSLVCRGSCT